MVMVISEMVATATTTSTTRQAGTPDVYWQNGFWVWRDVLLDTCPINMAALCRGLLVPSLQEGMMHRFWVTAAL